MVQGLSAGYFLWDLALCVGRLDVHGVGAAVHAGCALAVGLFGFVSTPFSSSVLAGVERFAAWVLGGSGGAADRCWADGVIAAFLQLLRPQFHPLRALYPFLEYSLVYG